MRCSALGASRRPARHSCNFGQSEIGPLAQWMCVVCGGMRIDKGCPRPRPPPPPASQRSTRIAHFPPCHHNCFSLSFSLSLRGAMPTQHTRLPEQAPSKNGDDKQVPNWRDNYFHADKNKHYTCQHKGSWPRCSSTRVAPRPLGSDDGGRVALWRRLCGTVALTWRATSCISAHERAWSSKGTLAQPLTPPTAPLQSNPYLPNGPEFEATQAQDASLSGLAGIRGAQLLQGPFLSSRFQVG